MARRLVHVGTPLMRRGEDNAERPSWALGLLLLLRALGWTLYDGFRCGWFAFVTG